MSKYLAMAYIISGINLTIWHTWIGVIAGGVFIGSGIHHVILAAAEAMVDDYEVSYGTPDT